MFRTSRPVPSKPALRVLYQLAYISSGTAVGVAALCAEERRRRTHVLQTIADNARRLRQNPRHVHHAAAQVETTDDYVVTTGLDDVFGARVDARRNETSRRLGYGVPDMSVRGAELPSAVEKGYEQVVALEDKRARVRAMRSKKTRRKRSHDSLGAGAIGAYEEAALNAINSDSVNELSKLQLRRVQSTNRRFAIHDNPDRLRDTIYDVYRRNGSDEPLHCVRKRRHANAQRIAISKLDFKTTNATHEEQEWATPLHFSANLTQDIELFFQAGSSTQENHSWEPTIANRLLLNAIQAGSLAEIRSLVLWKIAHDQLREKNIFRICNAVRSLAARIELEDLVDLYIEIFQTQQFQSMSTNTRLALGLRVTSNVLSEDLDPGDIDVKEALLKPILGGAEPTDLAGPISAYVSAMLEKDDPHRAINPIFIILNLCDISLTDSMDRIFDVAVNGRHIVCCNKILQWKKVRGYKDSTTKQQYDSFIRVCGQANANGMLTSLVDELQSPQWFDWLVPGLSDQAKVVLVLASTATDKCSPEVFAKLQQQIPNGVGGLIDASQVAATMRATWRSTRNLDQVWDQYTVLQERNSQRTLDNPTLQSPTVAMIEIFISANQLDRAMRLLSKFHKFHPNKSQIISLTAVSMAKNGSWDKVDQLMEILTTLNQSAFERNTMHNLNSMVELYSRQYTAEETFRFVRSTLKKAGILPNGETTDVVLRCFVSKRALEYIPEWLSYLETLGRRLELDARLVVKLLTEYYFQLRPSHVLVMWFCRNLAHFLPSLDAWAFRDLIKLSIGYDLRKGAGVKKHLRVERARMNLDILENSSDPVPPPAPKPDLTEDHLISRHGNSTESPPKASGMTSVINPDQGKRTPMTRTTVQSSEPASNSIGKGVNSKGHSSDNIENLEVVDTSPRKVISPFATPIDELQDRFPEKEDFHEDKPDDLDITEGFHEAYKYLPVQEDSTIELFRYSTSEEWDSSRLVHDPLDGRSLQHIDGHSAVDNYQSPRLYKVQRAMISAFSLQRYQEVLSLYHESCNKGGLPVSAIVLEMAVDASIRLRHGDQTEADRILLDAKEAGMNVSCAVGPLLLHSMKRKDEFNKHDGEQLRLMVMDYYRSNHENGWPIKHFIGISAADVLSKSRLPKYAINILRAMQQSEWASEQPLDISAMAVFLKSYRALKSEEGIEWVLHTVLDQDMRLSRTFMDTLKNTVGIFTWRAANNAHSCRPNPSFVRSLTALHQACIERRARQKRQARDLGQALVNCLANYSLGHGDSGFKSARITLRKARHARYVREDTSERLGT